MIPENWKKEQPRPPNLRVKIEVNASHCTGPGEATRKNVLITSIGIEANQF